MTRPGPSTVRLRASRVIATANTPSLNASSLDRSTSGWLSARRAGVDPGQDLVHAVLDLPLPSRHVLAGELVQDGQHPVLAVQDVELLLSHLVQRDEGFVVGDGPPAAGALAPRRPD